MVALTVKPPHGLGLDEVLEKGARKVWMSPRALEYPSCLSMKLATRPRNRLLASHRIRVKPVEILVAILNWPWSRKPEPAKDWPGLERPDLGILTLLGSQQNCLERLDRGLGGILAHVGRASKLGLWVEGALGRNQVEKRNGLLELAFVVVYLPSKNTARRAPPRAAGLQFLPVVLSDLLQNDARIHWLMRERRQPLQGFIVVGMRGTLLDDAIEE